MRSAMGDRRAADGDHKISRWTVEAVPASFRLGRVFRSVTVPTAPSDPAVACLTGAIRRRPQPDLEDRVGAQGEAGESLLRPLRPEGDRSSVARNAQRSHLKCDQPSRHDGRDRSDPENSTRRNRAAMSDSGTKIPR